MGRIAVTEFVSVDGVMEAPGGEPGFAHTNWVSRFPDTGQFDWKLREILADDALLLGRVTYESFAGAWPDRDGPFAEKMHAMPKFVLSRTLKDASWNNASVLHGDFFDAVRDLKERIDGTLQVAGSHSVVQFLRANRLVDEYRLMTFPIVLGSGFRVFEPSADAEELRLVSFEAFGGSGVTAATYVPA